jgi:general secretion pathway protein J
MRDGDPDRQAGFTLLEVLVATALAGLLSLMLLGGVQTGGQVLEKSGARADRLARLGAASAYLRSHLAAAVPLEARQDGGTAVRFEGRPDSLSFIGLASPWQAVGGYQAVTLRVAPRADGIALIADWQPDRPGETARSSTLLDDLAAAEFSYFGMAAGQSRAAWHDHWQNQPVLPGLIRLRLKLNDGREPPALLVAPRLTRGTADG